MGPVNGTSPGTNKDFSKTFTKVPASEDPSSVLFTGKFDATATKQKSKFNLEFPIQFA
jgi:hypothetical protein